VDCGLSVDAVGVYSAVTAAVKLLRRVHCMEVVFLKKILRVVVDFDEEL